MTYEQWIQSRYERFQEIFKDFAVHKYDGYDETSCFEIVVGKEMFRLWIAKEEFIKNTLEQCDKLWQIRLNDLKWDIEERVKEYAELFNGAIERLATTLKRKIERKIMSNIKITVEIDGKQVPLETVSTETFEAIKALEKPKEIPVARLTDYSLDNSEPRLLFRPTENMQLKIGKIYSLDLKRGLTASNWKLENDEWAIKNTYPTGTREL